MCVWCDVCVVCCVVHLTQHQISSDHPSQLSTTVVWLNGFIHHPTASLVDDSSYQLPLAHMADSVASVVLWLVCGRDMHSMPLWQGDVPYTPKG